MKVLVFFVSLVLVLRSRTEGLIKLPANETVPAVITFGDSIADTGNNNNLKSLVKANFPPYGRNLNGGIPTGRFSNGRVPSDFLVEELGIKELLPAYTDPNLRPDDLVTGVCFASGGSGYDPLTPTLVVPVMYYHVGYVVVRSIETIQRVYNKSKRNCWRRENKIDSRESLVAVVAGSDDIANTYFSFGIRRSEYDISSYTDLMLRSASVFVKELYGLGIRKVGVLGVPPVGCVPFRRTVAGGIVKECSEQENEAAKMFDSKLSAELSYLNNHLPHSRIVYIDIYNPFLDIVQNPRKYGFEVVNKGCCGTGRIEVAMLCNEVEEPETCKDESDYVFWDSYHPTEGVYKILISNLLNKYINSFF